MNVLLATYLVLLAQEDTGAASRFSILIGILAFPCLVIIAVVWQRLKNAKESDKHIEELQRKVVELEHEKVKQEQEQEWEDMVKELEQETPTKLPVIGLDNTSGPINVKKRDYREAIKRDISPQTNSPLTPNRINTAALRIVHVEDEDCLLKMIAMIIRDRFSNVTLQSFQDSNEAWHELSRTEPDLLITDDTMPGLSGEELVRRLVERKVQYPIIVTSGWPPTEQWVRKYADTDFNITFLHCPFELSELYKEINRQLGAKLQFQNRKPEQGLTKAQQAFMDEVFARAGNPSAAFQRQIDEIRAVKTEDELKILVRRDANVERPTIEAELLCVVYMAKLAELNPNINAEKLKEEQHEATT